MTHIITSLCVRDRGCIDVCPVECMIPGQPINEWPWIYIDPDTCIDCGACVPECPYEAIFPEEEVPVEDEAADLFEQGRAVIFRSTWIHRGLIDDDVAAPASTVSWGKP